VTNPVGCHLNGGVNLATTDDVLRTVATTLRGRVRRIPDGEVDAEGQRAEDAGEPRRGSRQNWIWFLTTAYDRAQGVHETESAGVLGDPFPQYAISGDPSEIRFDGLGYADEYAKSYERFTELKAQGVIEGDVLFQAQFPTSLAASFWFTPADQQRAYPAVAAALRAEIGEFLDQVGPDVAIQLDVAVEIGALEGAFGPTPSVETIADTIAADLNAIPDDVEAGLHLCYGDYRHKHTTQPESLALQVKLINAVTARARRPLNWVSITVPQNERRPEFFAPLEGLRIRSETELYFGIVPYHPDEQEAGTSEAQVELIERYVQQAHGAGRAAEKSVEWGVCTECGMARVEREDVGTLLGIYAELTEPVREAAPA
jgi:methionine synthase II (cobalamin-independent)